MRFIGVAKKYFEMVLTFDNRTDGELSDAVEVRTRAHALTDNEAVCLPIYGCKRVGPCCRWYQHDA
eukprot:3307156-Pyramimonas_sp.AAC.1